jgi:hypothetical protein
MAKSSSSRISVTSLDKLPTVEHWAILQDASYTIPGDERSRTNPGHGYPESTEHFITYVAFTDKEEFESELKRQIETQGRFGNRPVRGIHVAGLYTSEIVVHLNEKA